MSDGSADFSSNSPSSDDQDEDDVMMTVLFSHATITALLMTMTTKM